MPVDLVILEEDFRLKAKACMVFPPKLFYITTRKVISYFQVHITNTVKHIDHICCCCSQFVDPVELNLIPDNEPILIVTFETNILHCSNLDICGCFKTFNFCHNC